MSAVGSGSRPRSTFPLDSSGREEAHQDPGHHLRGQPPGDRVDHLIGGRPVVVRDQIPHQPWPLPVVDTDRGRGPGDPGRGQQRGLDGREIDADTVDLRVVVQPADEFHLPLLIDTHQITGAVQAPSAAVEWIGYEAPCGLFRVAEVAAGQPDTADEQLSDLPVGHRGQCVVEHMDPGTADRTAHGGERSGGPGPLKGGALKGGPLKGVESGREADAGRLGDTVGVDDIEGQPAGPDPQLLTARHQQAQRAVGRPGDAEEPFREPGHHDAPGHPLVQQPVTERPRLADGAFLGDGDGRARGQRSPQLPS